MTTDWKALCAELAENVRYLLDCVADGDSDPAAIAECVQHLGATRALLAQPEPEEPTDEELEAIARAAEIQYMKEHGGLTASTPDGIHAQLRVQRIAGLRAVAARWGRPATPTETP